MCVSIMVVYFCDIFSDINNRNSEILVIIFLFRIGMLFIKLMVFCECVFRLKMLIVVIFFSRVEVVVVIKVMVIVLISVFISEW